MGALAALIVMTGMHYALFPSTFQNFAALGYDIVLMPMMLINTLAQSGAALAVAVRSKDSKTRSLAMSTGLTAFLGITEPAMYGITLKYKKPFYAAMIGSGIGCGFATLFSVKMFSFAMPSVISLPLFIKEGTNNFLYTIISILLSFVISFVLTLVFGFKEDTAENNSKSKIENRDNTVSIDVVSPIKGETRKLSEVKDKVFSKELTGKGVAVVPSDNTVYSPFNGEVVAVLESNHAIGIRSNDGVELLIHVGLETVGLGKKYFKRYVEKGEHIKPGQKLLDFDMEGLRNEGVDLITPVIVSNTSEYSDVIPFEFREVNPGDVIFTITK
jgi:PTS system beta-glucosides-specific IIC component